MSAGDIAFGVFLVILLLVVVGGVVWTVVNAVQNAQERSLILDQCWQCGWGKVVYVDDEYYCHGWESGTESVRSLEWVQENACQ